MKNNIFHLDMDSFFASVEEKNISKKNTSLVVCNNLEKSIILSANYFAKSKGINSGMPLFLAKEKDINLVVIKPNLILYKQVSDDIEKILFKYTSNLIKASIDEWYMDFSNSKLVFNNEYELASRIQNEIINKIGITCSIGISFNNFFAKMGSKLNKPKNIEIITDDNFKEKIWNLDINKMHSIGKVKFLEMKNLGINKIYDLANFKNPELLKEKFGIQGQKIYEYSNGIFNEYDSIKSKSISLSKTFLNELDSEEEIFNKFKEILNNILFKIKDQNILIKRINISFTSKIFEESKSFTFLDYTKDCKIIYFQSMILFDKIKNKEKIKKINITFNKILFSFQISEQLNFFEKDTSKNKVEKINHNLKKNLIDYAIKIK